MLSCLDEGDFNRRVGVFKKFIGHGVIFFEIAGGIFYSDSGFDWQAA